MAYLQNRHEEQERAEARVRAHLLKYHVDVVNVLICPHSSARRVDEDADGKDSGRATPEHVQRAREAEEKRIQLERTKSQADNQRDLMQATVGVEISGKRAEQRKAEGEAKRTTFSKTGARKPRRCD